MSSTWRVSVDLDTGLLRAAQTRESGQKILGQLGNATERRLSASELAGLSATARDVLEHDDTPQAVFTADSMQLLAIADGNRAYELTPAGPITEGPAAELMGLLYRLAWPPG